MKYDEVSELLGQLWEKVGEYMDGKSMMKDRVLLEMYYEKKPMKEGGLDFNEMGEEEVEMRAREVLEKLGGIVIMPADMGVSVDAAPEEKPKKGEGLVVKEAVFNHDTLGTSPDFKTPIETKLEMPADEYGRFISAAESNFIEPFYGENAADINTDISGSVPIFTQKKGILEEGDMKKYYEFLENKEHLPIEGDDEESMVFNITPVKTNNKN